jgi:hypothetical protein
LILDVFYLELFSNNFVEKTELEDILITEKDLLPAVSGDRDISFLPVLESKAT